jgi:hypothetical protein
MLTQVSAMTGKHGKSSVTGSIKPPDGPSRPWWTAALRQAVAEGGIVGTGARPLSDGYRATVALPRAGRVARIARPGDGWQGLQAEIDFALLAARHGLPVLAPAAGRPVVTTHGAVSFWPLLRPTRPGAAVSWSWLASVLARIRRLPATGYPHASDPFARISDASPATVPGRAPTRPLPPRSPWPAAGYATRSPRPRARR